MKLIFKTVLISLIIILFTFFFKAFFLRDYIVVNFLFPPSDFWEKQKISNIDVSKIGFVGEKTIKVKYPGKYIIVGLPKKYMNMSVEYDSDFELKIILTQGSLKKEYISKKPVTSWGYDKSSDLVFKYFDTRKDFNRKKPFKVSVFVTKSDKDFHNKYGKMNLYFTKSSDE